MPRFECAVSHFAELPGWLAQRYGERPAVRAAHHALSYADLELLSRRMACWLKARLVLQPGERVVLQLPNTLHFPVLFLALQRVGCISVALSTSADRHEIGRVIRDTEARAFVFFDGNEEAQRYAKTNPDAVLLIKARSDDFASLWELLLGRVKRLGVHPRLQVRALKFISGLKFAPPPGFGLPPLTAQHPAVIQYTGGTTGAAKGVMLTHDNLFANICQLIERLGESGDDRPQRLLQPLPIYHAYPMMLCLVQWVMGGVVELVTDARDTNRLVELFDSFKPTLFAGISPIFIALCQHPLFGQLDFRALQMTISGGAPLNSSVAERWKLITGCGIAQGYGLTETSPVVTFDAQMRGRSGYVGKLLPETQIRIADEVGNLLPPGTVGQIEVRGPQVMAGYWHNPELTDAVISPNGWLKTGDIGRLEANNELRVIERSSDVIQVPGFRVYPSEIESIVSEHPDVIDCAVIGVPDETGSLRIKLFVITNNRRLTHKAVRNYCKERLTSYKVPKLIEFRTSLPRSPVGKVLRNKLIQESLAG